MLLIALAVDAGATAQDADITGWWVTQIPHGDEREPIYLHFELQGGHPRAHFSTPRVRVSEADLGPYAVSGTRVQLPGVKWEMTLTNGGAAIDGTMIDGLFPERVPVHFTRADGSPPMPPGPAPQGLAPAPVWTASVNAPVWGGVVYDQSRNALYVADDAGKVTALKAQSGTQLWSRKVGARVRATPTLRGTQLFVVSDEALVVINSHSGRKLWSMRFGPAIAPRLSMFDPNSKGDFYAAAAVVWQNIAVVVGRDGCVYSLDANSGARHWRVCTGHLITGTPAVTHNGVYFGSFDNKAHGLSLKTGAELWQYDTHWPIPRDAVVNGDTVLFGSRSYDLVSLNARNGRLVWDRFFWFSWVDSVPVLLDGIVYVGSSDALVVQAFDAATGRLIWSTPVDGWSWPRVGVSARCVYAALVGGRVTAPRRGGLAAIDRRGGAMHWLLPSRPPEDPHALWGFASAPAVSRNRVYVADLAGRVQAFEDRC